MTYALSTLSWQDRALAVVEHAGKFWDATQLVPDVLPVQDGRGWMSALERWAEVEASLFHQVLARTPKVPPLPAAPMSQEVLAPLLYPRKVICTGANYREHLGEVGFSSTFDKRTTRPSFFLKPPTTSVVGAGRSVPFPAQTEQFDWEIELAVVIGRRGRHIPVAAALDFVAGYTIGLDLSARDYLLHPGNITGFDSFGGKAFDGSCPLGPRIVPARFIADPQALALRLSVNGELKQDSNTVQMIWPIAEQIAEISAILTLEPGDVILTGTPSGAGLKSGTFLKPGDRIEAEIQHLGSLHLEIAPPVAEPLATPMTPLPPASAGDVTPA